MSVTLTPVADGDTDWGGTVNSYWDAVTKALKGDTSDPTDAGDGIVGPLKVTDVVTFVDGTDATISASGDILTLSSLTVYAAGTLSTPFIDAGSATLTGGLSTDSISPHSSGLSISGNLAFFGATPTSQPSAIADATNATDVITQLNAALAALRTLGLIAT